jgi:hypothetical protein
MSCYILLCYEQCFVLLMDIVLFLFVSFSLIIKVKSKIINKYQIQLKEQARRFFIFMQSSYYIRSYYIYFENLDQKQVTRIFLPWLIWIHILRIRGWWVCVLFVGIICLETLNIIRIYFIRLWWWWLLLDLQPCLIVVLFWSWWRSLIFLLFYLGIRRLLVRLLLTCLWLRSLPLIILSFSFRWIFFLSEIEMKRNVSFYSISITLKSHTYQQAH